MTSMYFRGTEHRSTFRMHMARHSSPACGKARFHQRAPIVRMYDINLPRFENGGHSANGPPVIARSLTQFDDRNPGMVKPLGGRAIPVQAHNQGGKLIARQAIYKVRNTALEPPRVERVDDIGNADCACDACVDVDCKICRGLSHWGPDRAKRIHNSDNGVQKFR